MSSGGAAPGDRRPPYLLYAGLVLFLVLAAVTARSIHLAWQERLARSRAEAVFALVQDKTPNRPTETPGVTAWLHHELERFERAFDDPERARRYGEMVGQRDQGAVPPLFEPLRAALMAKPVAIAPATLSWVETLDSSITAAHEPLQHRSQRFLEHAGKWLVVTRRSALDSENAAGQESDRFLGLALHRFDAVHQTLQRTLSAHPLPALPGDQPPRIVRLYAVAEDGTLLSLPFAEAPDDDGARCRAASAEGQEFRRQPRLPTYVSNEFFFRFDFSQTADQAYYSGLYLDLGGQGLVATIMVPLRAAETGLRGTLSLDLTFDMDWTGFARRIEPPLLARVVSRAAAPPPGSWQPWTALSQDLGPGSDGRPDGGGDGRLAAAVAQLAEREQREGTYVGTASVHHSVAEGHGTVAAFQVARTTWLLILFPEAAAGFPWPALLFLALTLICLFAGFELNRQRAERAQRKAERELSEKQNLLNTMQVPLAVVDPNSDEVVHANEAAARLGITPGERFGALVAPDPRAQAHYARMQVSGPKPHRAYGVPLRVRGAEGEETRHAIVRSVAVTAPIETLRADQRHRLGVLFLLEPEVDLAIFVADLAGEIRSDERRRLAGLLSHGVDLPARLLARRLAADGRSDNAFTAWLATYLDRRLQVTGWLLDRWHTAGPLPPACSVEADQARATVERWEQIFRCVREDADLRAQLHWENGALAAPADGAVLTHHIHWPADRFLPCAVRGGFGFFLGEVLINAVKHGRPGTRPRLEIHFDRGREELGFLVENTRRDTAEGNGQDGVKPYGGRRMLERLAALFDWQDLRFEAHGDTFAVSWRAPASERGAPTESD